MKVILNWLKNLGCLPICWKFLVFFQCIKKWRSSSIMLKKLRSSSIVLKSEGRLLLCWKVEVIFHCIKKWGLSSIMLKSWGQQKIRLHFTLQKFEVVFHFEENKWGWDDFLFIQDYSRQPVGREPGDLKIRITLPSLAAIGADLGN